MKSKFKALSTVLLAIIMVFAMSISTFAASGDGSNLGTDNSIKPDRSGIISNGGVLENGRDSGDKTHGVFTGVGNTVTLDKEIVIFNTRSSNTVVYLPNIKYEYTVAAVNVDNDTGSEKYIIDEYGNKGAINDGVARAINNGETNPFVQFSNGEVGTAGITGTGMTRVETPYVTTKTTGFAAEGHFNLTFNPSEFTKPGIYRYSVTEEPAEGFSKETAGIIDNDTYNNVRYLDVYVQNKSDNSGLEIYGYVCFEDTSKNKEFEANPGTAITTKTNGFVSEKNDTITDAYNKSEVGVDIYETSNVKVTKTISGAMADMSHKFPFKAVIVNGTITNKAKISYEVVAKDGTESTDEPAPGASLDSTATMTSGTGVIGASNATVDPSGDIKLGHGEFLYIYGVPGKNTASTVEATEKNDTQEFYKVSMKYDDTTDLDVTSSVSGTVATMNAAATAKNTTAQTIDISKTQDVLAVTNKLNSISPTNVVMRYAPYLFILGAGIMLLMMSRRRKEEQE